MADIRITAEPAGNTKCTFTTNVPLYQGGARRFTSAADAAGSALPEALFAIPGVTDVVVTGPAVTVTKSDNAPWQATGKAVGAAIRAAVESGRPLVEARMTPGDPAADDALYSKVSMIFDTRINPMVAGHGGHVDLIDVQDGVVMLRMMGGCQGCGMASVTLKQGIETTLKQMAPEVAGVMDVTDHASGTDPYFASSKK